MLPMDVQGRGILAEERQALLRGEVRSPTSSRRMRRRLGTVLIAAGLRLAPGALPADAPAVPSGEAQRIAASVWASRTGSSRARAGA
jgi:hypothetical protein